MRLLHEPRDRGNNKPQGFSPHRRNGDSDWRCLIYHGPARRQSGISRSVQQHHSARPSPASFCSCSAVRRSTRPSTPNRMLPMEFAAFSSIATSAAGVSIGEHFPRLAQRAHRYAIVRSVSHTDNFHGSSCHYVLTGTPYPRGANLLGAGPTIIRMSAWRPGGCVLAMASCRHLSGCSPRLLRWPSRPRQRRRLPGQRYDPFVVARPHRARLSSAGVGISWTSLPRLPQRQGLLDSSTIKPINSCVVRRPRSPASLFRERPAGGPFAHSRPGLDLAAEPGRIRDHYGRHCFGQGVIPGAQVG